MVINNSWSVGLIIDDIQPILVADADVSVTGEYFPSGRMTNLIAFNCYSSFPRFVTVITRNLTIRGQSIDMALIVSQR